MINQLFPPKEPRQPEQQTSIFDASRKAAQEILDNAPNVVLHYETQDMARVRSFLIRHYGVTDEEVSEHIKSYRIIENVKSQLGIN